MILWLKSLGLSHLALHSWVLGIYGLFARLGHPLKAAAEVEALSLQDMPGFEKADSRHVAPLLMGVESLHSRNSDSPNEVSVFGCTTNSN